VWLELSELCHDTSIGKQPLERGLDLWTFDHLA